MTVLVYLLQVSVMLGVRCSVVAAITDVMNITRKVASTSSDTSLNLTALAECVDVLSPCYEDSACVECYDDIETSGIDECDLDSTSDSIEEISCDTWSVAMCCAETIFDGGCPADEAYISLYECFLDVYGCSTEGSQCDENFAAPTALGGALLSSILCSIALVFVFTVGMGI